MFLVEVINLTAVMENSIAYLIWRTLNYIQHVLRICPSKEFFCIGQVDTVLTQKKPLQPLQGE